MSWLVPIGTPGGICSGFEGVPDGFGMVRLGTELISLHPDLYSLWHAAAAAPQAEELIGWASAEGIAEPEEQVRALHGSRLLLEGRPGAESSIGELVLKLTGECLGNGHEPSARFRLLGRGGTEVAVDPYTYEVLLRSDGLTPIGALCEEQERARPDLAPQLCLRSLFGGMPILVRAGVARLDRGEE